MTASESIDLLGVLRKIGLDQDADFLRLHAGGDRKGEQQGCGVSHDLCPWRERLEQAP